MRVRPEADSGGVAPTSGRSLVAPATMKNRLPRSLALLSALAFCATPLLASSLDGQGKKKEPPKKEAPKPAEKKPEPKKAEPAAKPAAIGGEVDGALEDTA